MYQAVHGAELHLIKILSKLSTTKSVTAQKASITRKDYPTIVKLKLAGNTDKVIAKKLGVRTEQLKPHINRALDDYRNGKTQIDNGETVKEARKVGAEKSTLASKPAPVQSSISSVFTSVDIVS